MESEDIEIVRRVKNGESGAYAVLVRKYHRHLLNFIFHLLRDESIVEDIGQEVFISAYRSLSNFDDGRSVPFSAWLFIIARNKCISEMRKRKTNEFVPLFEEVSADGRIPASDERLLQKERKAALLKALENLDEPFREAIIQSLKGATIEEISRSCNIPISTVKTRLFRAREKLRILMKTFA